MSATVDEDDVLRELAVRTLRGLRSLEQSPLPGVRALIEVGIMKRPLDSGAIGFQLAPRINAAGRLGHPATALELLLTNRRLGAREALGRAEKVLDEALTRPAAEDLRARVFELGEAPTLEKSSGTVSPFVSMLVSWLLASVTPSGVRSLFAQALSRIWFITSFGSVLPAVTRSINAAPSFRFRRVSETVVTCA